MVSEAQKRAKRNYDKKTRQFVFRFRKGADADVIERLAEVESKTDYVRQLVMRDVRATAEAPEGEEEDE